MHQCFKENVLSTVLFQLARLAHLPTGLYILLMFFSLLFSALGKVAGRAIYFTDVFSLFFKNFLVVAHGALLAQKPMDRSSPKFQDW